MADSRESKPDAPTKPRSRWARLRAAPADGVEQLREMGDFLSAVAYAARKVLPIVHEQNPKALWALIVFSLIHTTLSAIQYRTLPFIGDALQPGADGTMTDAEYWHLATVGGMFCTIVVLVYGLGLALDYLTGPQDHAIRRKFASFASRFYARMGVMAFYGTPEEKRVQGMLGTADYNLLFVIPGLIPALRFAVLGTVNLALVLWHAPLAGFYLSVGIVLSSIFELHGATLKHAVEKASWKEKGRATAWRKCFSNPVALKATIVSGRVNGASERIERITEDIITKEAIADLAQLRAQIISWVILAATIFGVGFTILDGFASGELAFGETLMLVVLVPLTFSNWRTATLALARQALGATSVRELFQFLEQLESNPQMFRNVSVGRRPVPSRGIAISIENLRFRYQPDLPFVLPGLVLRICVGEQFFLCAGTGVGKTTLTDLLLGILPIMAGMVFIDGDTERIDLTEIDPELYRQHVLCITQDTARPVETPKIWFATALGMSDPDNLPDEEIWQALDDACIGDDVRKWKDKLHERLSTDEDARTAMSGGMLKRFNIAEIALKLRRANTRIRVVVLDEPYEGINAELIEKIHARLSQLARERGITLIIPWHRVKDFPNDSQIVFVDVEGETSRVYRGTRDELVRDVPAFRRYANIPLPEEVHATQ
ncbi:MAG: ABC transporter ATP-binding protein [Deltaproteobacteria bacterium]|nr:ABC transporter ATP-binding protein [Deltaproteobacteria bacterium]